MTSEELLQAYQSGKRDFPYANLLGANLRGADLRYANLRGADLNTNSHDLISIILYDHAKEMWHYKIAGLPLVMRHWCWREFYNNLTEEERLWSASVLEAWPCFERKCTFLRTGERK